MRTAFGGVGYFLLLIVGGGEGAEFCGTNPLIILHSPFFTQHLHMKNLFFLCLALMFSLQCSKDNKDDPRDAFVGTYFISAQYICSDLFGNFLSSSGYTGTIVVTKGANENQLSFSDTYKNGHTVTLSGSNFKIEDFPISGGGIGSGGGSFGSNSISYNLGNSYGGTVCSEEGSGTK